MLFKDRVCCICDEHKEFLSRPNGGQKLYCMQCKAKITKEHGQGYWKPCSFGEFLEASSKSMEKKSDDKETFDHVSKYYDDGYYNEE
jgi:hypothetical protein